MQVATDQELLEALADETREDFAILGVVRFAVAYLGTRVTKIKPLDPNSTMQPKTTRTKGVVIELHGVAEPVRLFRQIIKPPRGQPVLAAACELDPPTDSPYAAVLACTTTASCANDAEAPAGWCPMARSAARIRPWVPGHVCRGPLLSWVHRSPRDGPSAMVVRKYNAHSRQSGSSFPAWPAPYLEANDAAA
jgi:hypothetical protein